MLETARYYTNLKAMRLAHTNNRCFIPLGLKMAMGLGRHCMGYLGHMGMEKAMGLETDRGADLADFCMGCLDNRGQMNLDNTWKKGIP